MNKEFLDQIGHELKHVRKKLNYTLDQASEITGINKSTLSTYENNPNIIKLGKLFTILKGYDYDVDIFFNSISEYIHNNKERKNLMNTAINIRHKK